MRPFNLRMVAFVMSASLALAGSVQAVPISVVNPGFTYTTGTSSDIADYPTSNVNTYGWNNAAALNGGVDPIAFNDFSGGSDNRMVVPGWTSTSPSGLDGVQSLDSTYWLLKPRPTAVRPWGLSRSGVPPFRRKVNKHGWVKTRKSLADVPCGIAGNA